MGSNLIANTLKTSCTSHLVRSSLFPEVLRFRLEDVHDDPLFGNANGLEGEIPFLRPTKPLQEFNSHLVDNPEIADRLARELVSKYRDLWENMDDDAIFAHVRDIANFLLPLVGAAWDGNNLVQRDQLVMTMILTYAIDNIYDKAGPDGVPRADEFDYAEVMANLRGQEAPDTKILPSGFADFEMLSKLMQTALAETEKVVPGLTQLYPRLRDTIIPGIAAFIVTSDLDREGGLEGLRFSEETMAELRRDLSGFRITVVIMELFKGIDVEPGMRNDDLFMIAVDRAADIISVQNALLGLNRDIRLHQIDSPITYSVVHNGVQLQEAFDTSMRKLQALYNDYAVARRMLLQLYKNEPQLVTYMEFIDSVVDGMLFAYTTAERYCVRDRSQITDNPNFKPSIQS